MFWPDKLIFWLGIIIIILLVITIVITFIRLKRDRELFRDVIDIVNEAHGERKFLEDREELLEITTSMVVSQLQSRQIEVDYISNSVQITNIIDNSCYFAQLIIDTCDENIAGAKNIHDIYKTPGEDKSARGGS